MFFNVLVHKLSQRGTLMVGFADKHPNFNVKATLGHN